MAGRIAYYGNIVKDGLVLDLDAAKKDSYPGSGTVWNDISGNGNSGSLVNGPTFSSANAGSLVFNGTNNYVSGSSNIGIVGDFNATLSVWVNILELSTGYKCICMFGSTGAMQGFSIFSNIAAQGAGSITIGFYGLNNGYTAASTIVANTWYNMVATKTSGAFSSSNTKLYINGTLQSLTFTTPATPNGVDGKYYIGNDPANEISNNMRIANFQIYNRALSASEVLQNYNAQKSRYGL
jgi:hypothetical protein